jgi:chemotaxis methyl-accepting protein methylase
VSPLALSATDLASLRKFLEKAYGLRGEDYRDSFLARRLEPRLAATGRDTAKDYLEHLRKHPSEAEILLTKLLVPTTEFFRNSEVFDELKRTLRERIRSRSWKAIRILSAPCSTGQEPVSLSILLEELDAPGLILAADRSLGALSALSAGIYPLKSLDDMDKARRERYFTVEESRARVARRVLRRICPLCCDLSRGLPAGPFHVVLLRNLFIYLTSQAQERLMDEAGEALVPGGLLVLGRVETACGSASRCFKAVSRDARIYEKVL